MYFSPLSLHESAAWSALLALSFDRSTKMMEQLLQWLHSGYPVIAWGAWDEDQLVAQYACLLVAIRVSRSLQPVLAGMSLNMCVHPDYRGRGLIKQVSQPVYKQVMEQGGAAGIGFSNAEGVQVDRNSKGYGYQVLGNMQATVGLLIPARHTKCLELMDTLPPDLGLTFDLTESGSWSTEGIEGIHFVASPQSILHRYTCHPFRKYHYGVWREADRISGVVIYRPIRLRGIPGAAVLGAYGRDLPELMRRWAVSMHHTGYHVTHVLTSPESTLLSALRQTAVCIPVPTRSPYYLTAKALKPETASHLFDFARWDCAGGDIL